MSIEYWTQVAMQRLRKSTPSATSQANGMLQRSGLTTDSLARKSAGTRFNESTKKVFKGVNKVEKTIGTKKQKAISPTSAFDTSRVGNARLDPETKKRIYGI